MFRKPQILLYSQAAIKFLLFVVLTSQFTAVAISAFDFSTNDAVAFSHESEDPKPKDGKNAFDAFEENKILVAYIPLAPFFSGQIVHTWYKERFLIEVNYTLELPPPETV